MAKKNKGNNTEVPPETSTSKGEANRLAMIATAIEASATGEHETGAFALTRETVIVWGTDLLDNKTRVDNTLCTLRSMLMLLGWREVGYGVARDNPATADLWVMEFARPSEHHGRLDCFDVALVRSLLENSWQRAGLTATKMRHAAEGSPHSTAVPVGGELMNRLTNLMDGLQAQINRLTGNGTQQ
ncbi:hypothetical protein [Frigoriglobus tundricola]|uniref:Uncharacterized protein n=1 Tax=Frigoriglobus tundricola TaxID=2774151 RepID=A0A6M5Z7P1_9BACT|nr:hypothetical protein [Frigoriglobus tundricola]QJX01253.1 hypothetical protein FTUN_8892 [Frigoriglobus tundricola]